MVKKEKIKTVLLKDINVNDYYRVILKLPNKKEVRLSVEPQGKHMIIHGTSDVKEFCFGSFGIAKVTDTNSDGSVYDVTFTD